VLGRDTPIWKLERRCNAGYARREIRAAPSATRAGAVSSISAFGPKVLVEGDHAIAVVRTAGDGAGRCGRRNRRRRGAARSDRELMAFDFAVTPRHQRFPTFRMAPTTFSRANKRSSCFFQAKARCSGVSSPRFSARIIHANPHQSETISPLA
jgi:hypothetical protein